MRFGSIETIKDDDNSQHSIIDRYHDGGVTAQYKRCKEKHIVANPKEETSLYLKFSGDLQHKRDTDVLVELTDDTSTRPMFTYDFSPKYKGGYMVILSWTERA